VVMITVTGMESSGTRALHNLVHEMTSEETRHISWPNGGHKWGPEYVKGDKVIIIVRRPDIRNQSAVNAGHVRTLEEADEQWYEGMKALASVPDALWVSYEAMIGNPEVQMQIIAHFLGCEPLNHTPDWRDENKKYNKPT